MSRETATTVLVYYFAFPAYRKEILRELAGRGDPDVRIVSGSTARGGVRPLTENDVDGLQRLPSIRIGPLSWDVGAVRAALDPRIDAVVLGPATTSLSTWMVLLLRRLLGRPSLLWGQCGQLGRRSPKRYAQELMNRLADKLLVYGRSEAAAAVELGLRRSKVHVVGNADRSNRDALARCHDDDSFNRMQQMAVNASESGHVVLTFAGRLVEEKRLEVLLDAARQLRRDFRNTRVEIIGNGRARTALEVRFPHEWITFHGVIDGEEVDRLLRSATFVTSPRGMGLLAVDALRAGVPALVPDNPLNGPEVEALTAGVNAELFAPGDSDALAEAARTWLGKVPSISPEDYRRARRTALEFWDPASVAERILMAARDEVGVG